MQIILIMKKIVRSLRLRTVLLALSNCVTLASYSGRGESMLMVLSHGCRGRPLNCIAFLDSLLRLGDGGLGCRGMMRVLIQYLYMLVVMCMVFNLS